MEEKKLTDEEIVKALDICTTADDDMGCIDDCPMYEEDYCTTKLLKMAFDLIHRLQDESAKQKAEIERLTEENFVLYRDRFTKKELDDIADFRVKKATAELQKQVDELKEELENKKAEEGEIYKWAKNNIFGRVE